MTTNVSNEALHTQRRDAKKLARAAIAEAIKKGDKELDPVLVTAAEVLTALGAQSLSLRYAEESPELTAIELAWEDLKPEGSTFFFHAWKEPVPNPKKQADPAEGQKRHAQHVAATLAERAKADAEALKAADAFRRSLDGLLEFCATYLIREAISQHAPGLMKQHGINVLYIYEPSDSLKWARLEQVWSKKSGRPASLRAFEFERLNPHERVAAPVAPAPVAEAPVAQPPVEAAPAPKPERKPKAKKADPLKQFGNDAFACIAATATSHEGNPFADKLAALVAARTAPAEQATA